MKEPDCANRRQGGRWANDWVENSHLPFRRREWARLRFRQMTSLQKFASVHASLTNHLSLDRHLVDCQTYRQRRSAALTEWQSLASRAAPHKARAASCGERFALD